EAHDESRDRKGDVEPVERAEAGNDPDKHSQQREKTPNQTKYLHVSPLLVRNTMTHSSLATSKAYKGRLGRVDRSASRKQFSEMETKAVVMPQNRQVPPRARARHTGASFAAFAPNTNGAASIARRAMLEISQTARSEKTRSLRH